MIGHEDEFVMLNNILDRYHSIPTPAKASLWFIICSAVQNGCKFLAMPILVRLLTTEQYGIYSVFLSWTSIISIFTTLNLHAGVYNNAMLKYPKRRDEYTSASQSLAMVVTGGVFCVYCLFPRWIDGFLGLEHGLVLLIFLQIFCTEGFQLWSTRQRYEYKYIPLVVFTAILSVSYMVLPVTAAYFAPNEIRLYAAIAAGVLVQVLFGGAFIIYNYIKSRCFFVGEFWRYALMFNIPLIPHYLSGIILGQADRVMIKRFIGAAEAGIYSFTYNISLVMNIITSAINSAIIPYTYGKLKKRDYTALGQVVNSLVLMVGGMSLAFSAIAPELFKIVATTDYFEAVYLVPIISLSSYFTFLYSMFGNVEFFFEENKFITVASVIGAVANIILNYIFLQIFGYFAAGYTTLFCYVLFALAHYVFMRVVCKRHIDGDKVYDGRTIFALSIVFVALAFGMMVLYNHPIIRYAIVLCAVVMCLFKSKTILNYLRALKVGKE